MFFISLGAPKTEISVFLKLHGRVPTTEISVNQACAAILCLLKKKNFKYQYFKRRKSPSLELKMLVIRTQRINDNTDLITEGMTTNNDGLRPTGNETRNRLTDDWLPEYGTAENVTDRSIGAQPHLLQFELCQAETTP